MTTTASHICRHGSDFNTTAPAVECQHCAWGTEQHHTAFTLLRPTVTAYAHTLANRWGSNTPAQPHERTTLDNAATAVAALAPIPEGITPRLRQAMIDATRRTMIDPYGPETTDPLVVAEINPQDWAVLRSRTAEAAGLRIVARVAQDGVACLD